ncbi:MAG TPA: OmpH family outer membrane protein [bacterium]|nr:OmpH family outer membrane protein [bacterium]
MTWILVGLLALGAAFSVGRCGAAPVGIVDTQRVLNESVKALQYQKLLDNREKQMVAELAAVATQITPADLSGRRARYLTELGQMKRDLEGQLTQELGQVAGEIAREDHLKLVLVKAPLWFGGRDITQQVIDRLK